MSRRRSRALDSDLGGAHYRVAETEIVVERDHKDRWVWTVTMLYVEDPPPPRRMRNVPTQDPSVYVDGGTFRHPEPGVVRGRCRDEAEAWEQARECVDDIRARTAALQARSYQRRTARVAL